MFVEHFKVSNFKKIISKFKSFLERANLLLVSKNRSEALHPGFGLPHNINIDNFHHKF